MKVLVWLVSVSVLALGLAGLAAGPAGADVLSNAYLMVREGGAANAMVGLSVGTAGDVNGDGYSDVLLNGRENNGTVWCYHGEAVPTFQAPAWSVSGGAQNWLGSQVSTAGDVNGDGYHDVIVGAPVYANGQSFEGAVYVYLGSASGLSPAPQIVIESNLENIGFAGAVDTAGDVNGDGYDDIVVGANRYTNGETNEGRVYVYHGSPSGMASTPAWTFESNVASAGLGLRVSNTGDVNGDGYGDILAAAPDFSNGQTSEGRVYLFLGSPSGLPASPSWTYESNVTGGRCGWGLGMAGDMNADGYSDIAFDTGSNNPATGAVVVFFGRANGPAAVPDRSFASNHGGFADVLYTAGDVNGDGCADLVATEMSLSDNTGSITILGGWEAGSVLPVLAYRGGQQLAEQFGADAQTAGDVNGDGYADVIVGAPRNDNAHVDEGVVRLYLGRASLPSGTASAIRDGGQDQAMYGYSVAQGDWNGDGYSDLAVGAPYWDSTDVDQGVVHVYYGSEAGYPAVADWAYTGAWRLGAFGYAVANAGDVDNDGYEELLIGEPFWGPATEGRGYLYKGSASGLEPSPSWTGTGDGPGGYYGMSLAGAGDVNGDGYGDVVVGAPMENNAQGHGGKVFLYYGTPEGLEEQASWTQTTGTDFDEFGRSVAGAGDVNGDGYSDLVIGAPGMGSTADEGYIFVLFGSPAGPAPENWHVRGRQVNGRFGTRVASAGDVNGDGYSDIIHGAPDYDASGNTDCGLAEVYLGASNNFLNLAWARVGTQASDRFGFSVGGGGDIDNDGYSDVMVCAPWSNGAAPDGGAAYLYLGNFAGVTLDPAWMYFDTDDWSNFGWSMNMSGDVTGDGVADVVFGQPYSGVTFGRFACFYGGRDVFPPSDGGVLRHPRQLRGDGVTPIALLGTSDASTGFRIRSVGRSAVGRASVQLEYQVSPIATAWSSPPVPGDVVDTGTPAGDAGSAVPVTAVVAGLAPDTEYHWRVRFRGDSPFFPATPWFSVPSNGAVESDLRTAAGSASVDGDGEGSAVPTALRFSRVGPNPCRDGAWLGFASPATGGMRLTIHDASGRRVATLVDGPTQAGSHSVPWNLRDDGGRQVPGGIYFARLSQGSAVATTKVIVRR